MMLVCTPQPVCPNGEKKVAQYCPKTIGQIIFYMNITLLKIAAKKFQKYLGFFCKKICYEEVQKSAQSGHTGRSRRRLDAALTRVH